MSYLIAAAKADKLKEEMKRIDSIASGDVAGFISSRYATKDESELEDAIGEMEDKYSDGEKPQWMAGIIYAIAQLRDAKYSTAGRKYVRAMSLNSRSKTVYNRALIFGEAESLDN